jgi:hypothetical protein
MLNDRREVIVDRVKFDPPMTGLFLRADGTIAIVKDGEGYCTTLTGSDLLALGVQAMATAGRLQGELVGDAASLAEQVTASPRVVGNA